MKEIIIGILLILKTKLYYYLWSDYLSFLKLKTKKQNLGVQLINSSAGNTKKSSLWPYHKSPFSLLQIKQNNVSNHVVNILCIYSSFIIRVICNQVKHIQFIKMLSVRFKLVIFHHKITCVSITPSSRENYL